jgi:hypothetical protein
MMIVPNFQSVFCEARFTGLSPWFAPVRLRLGLLRLRGIQFELVHRALCITAPRSTPIFPSFF